MSDRKILLYHRIRSVQTIQDFIDREFLNIKAQDLFDENKDFIFSQMSEADKTAYKESNGTYPTSGSDLNVNMVLPCPCKLLIDPKFITAEVAINQTNLQVDNDDFYSFEDEQVQKIVQEAAYSNEVDRRSPACQVVGWFKTLYRIFLDEEIGKRDANLDNFRQSYRNISSDVISIQTNVGKNGGNFSIRLPYFSSHNIWDGILFDSETGQDFKNTISSFLEKQNNKKYSLSSKEQNIYGDSYFERGNFNEINDYYSYLISSNDLLFIAFNAEQAGEDMGNQGYVSMIETGSYDMIGLVDEVKIMKNSQGAQVAIEVTGRDLMKLLIEDGSFFFNPSVVYDIEGVFINQNEIMARGDIVSVDEYAFTTTGEPMINPMNRMLGSRDLFNLISIFARKQNMELSFILKAVINQLSNIQVVPGSIFNGFPNRTTVLDLQPKEE